MLRGQSVSVRPSWSPERAEEPLLPLAAEEGARGVSRPLPAHSPRACVRGGPCRCSLQVVCTEPPQAVSHGLAVPPALAPPAGAGLCPGSGDCRPLSSLGATGLPCDLHSLSSLKAVDFQLIMLFSGENGSDDFRFLHAGLKTGNPHFFKRK